ncbi:hypothetical protein PHYPSEUDO_015227 [Phytophthora pseudosyringae]|uniref:Uncharacterized protein n=1 Tax=Phytophthora pseudosyringae TaxID=221518 RepID=A0A8T1W4C1_9STRA|nr:hypothetical protein PHYPSEUDO_015227 [Phytophthora pseudosyringae]
MSKSAATVRDVQHQMYDQCRYGLANNGMDTTDKPHKPLSASVLKDDSLFGTLVGCIVERVNWIVKSDGHRHDLSTTSGMIIDGQQSDLPSISCIDCGDQLAHNHPAPWRGIVSIMAVVGVEERRKRDDQGWREAVAWKSTANIRRAAALTATAGCPSGDSILGNDGQHDNESNASITTVFAQYSCRRWPPYGPSATSIDEHGDQDSGRRTAASCGVTNIDNQRECSVLEITSRNHDSKRAPPGAFVESDRQHVGQQRAASGASVSKCGGQRHGGGIGCSGQIWK